MVPLSVAVMLRALFYLKGQLTLFHSAFPFTCSFILGKNSSCKLAAIAAMESFGATVTVKDTPAGNVLSVSDGLILLLCMSENITDRICQQGCSLFKVELSLFDRKCKFNLKGSL